MKAAKVVKVIRNGALKIEVRLFADGRYGFDWQADKYDRKKVRLHNLADAVKRAEKLLDATKAGKLELMDIDPREFAEFLRWKASRRVSVEIPRLVKDFLEDKRVLVAKEELSEKHVSDLSGTLDPFAAKFPKGIDKLERKEVETWLHSFDTGPRRWNNMLSHIVALIRYARAHKHLDAEPTSVESIPRRKTTSKKETYSPEQMSALLRTVPLRWLPSIVGGGFCGLRPEEICPEIQSHKRPLEWEMFVWRKAIIDVPPETSKDGRRRLVPINATAMEWFAPWRHAKGPIVPRQKMSNKTSLWAKRAGIVWLFDGLRHSYASYMLALTQNLAQLSDWMGNSPKMIKDHYLDRKFEDEAREYMALTPEKVGRLDLPKVLVAA